MIEIIMGVLLLAYLVAGYYLLLMIIRYVIVKTKYYENLDIILEKERSDGNTINRKRT